MQLKTPITITEIITELTNIVLTDNAARRTVSATYRTQNGAALAPVVLWEGAAYDAIGDYTQVQAEERLIEFLTNPQNDTQRSNANR